MSEEWAVKGPFCAPVFFSGAKIDVKLNYATAKHHQTWLWTFSSICYTPQFTDNTAGETRDSCKVLQFLPQTIEKNLDNINAFVTIYII